MKITKKFLKHEYGMNRRTAKEIAVSLNMKEHTIKNMLTKFNVFRNHISEIQPPIGHKRCNDCKMNRPFNQFHNSKREKGGKAVYCIQCVARRAKKYAPKLTAERQQRKIKLILEFGNECNDCHSRNLPIAAFVFHHHSERMSNVKYRQPGEIISLKKIPDEEKSKWILLCANCHSVRHSKYKLSATRTR